MTYKTIERLTRITTGHGTSALGVEVILENWSGRMVNPFQGMGHGHLVVVEIRQPTEEEVKAYRNR